MAVIKWDVSGRTLMLIRLAEVHGSYAECVNEGDPGNGDALKYLNMIRERAGIPLYGSADLPEFLKVVSFETRVFSKRHYFFPVPSDDVDNDRQLVQNQGW